jgi:gamma-glutamylcyclotransferase (GGCT)/AIG2-like uncharacterized protein YtfP
MSGDGEPDRVSSRLERIKANPGPLFVYGSLMFAEVTEVLIGRNPQRTQATVDGWRVISLPGKVYPGLMQSVGAIAVGQLIHDLTNQEWAIMDAFENDIYDLKCLQPRELKSPAWAYVLECLIANPVGWNPQHFATTHLTEYLATCQRWSSRAAASPRTHPLLGL